jgi:hypothetical protein
LFRHRAVHGRRRPAMARVRPSTRRRSKENRRKLFVFSGAGGMTRPSPHGDGPWGAARVAATTSDAKRGRAPLRVCRSAWCVRLCADPRVAFSAPPGPSHHPARTADRSRPCRL